MLFVLLALALGLGLLAAPAHAADYTRDAVLQDGIKFPGVYYVKAVPGDSGATIGIPSLDKSILNAPTTESPAIIMGAAVPYEVKTGPTSYTPLSGGALYPPYSYFRYENIETSAFEGAPMKSVEIPAGCQWVYPDAFKGCTALKQVLILSADTRFTPTAFADCTDIYIFAPDSAATRALCTEGNGFIFVEIFP